MRVVVLLGGDSPEREVSLNSGKNIAQALTENGHEVIEFDPGIDTEKLVNKFRSFFPTDANPYMLLKNPGFLSNIQILKFLPFDIVFNGLHGGKGENGVVQTLMELSGIRFTGSDSVSCMLTMDKEISKRLLIQQNLPVAKAVYFSSIPDTVEMNDLNFPVIVKPADGGSSLGHTVLQESSGVTDAIKYAFGFGRKVMIEEYIKGKEIAAGVLAGSALPLVHIKPKHGIYDYECKYTSGMSEYQVPADLDAKLTAKVKNYAEQAYNLFHCADYARIDFLVKDNGEMVILEANTLPGMTSTSLFPKAAKAEGTDFNQLIEKIIKEAINKYEH
ncbi:MAG: D-alanine--D-alanine ligase [Calditrichae bacterium]|nr:D-alanine--D-alanine ligase [Calditrichota bacterium]MCB9059109.1 D-alanine--D-alanine ligase [Calditrichia bacterium]